MVRYAIGDSNINDVHFEKLSADSIPDVILVKKHYPDRKRRRNWQLKHLNEDLFPYEENDRYSCLLCYILWKSFFSSKNLFIKN